MAGVLDGDDETYIKYRRLHGDSISANAGRMTVGLRGKPTPNTDIWLKAGYLNGNDIDGTALGTSGGQYLFDNNIGLIGEIQATSDYTRYSVGLRFNY